jgi:predicted CXXCH cytochrome family protein
MSLRFTSLGALLLTALVAGCGADGATGPKGDTGPAGATGDTGAKGDTGDTGAKGDPGTVPSLVNDIQGTVTDASGAALTGVTVTADPGAKTATTDATGAFKFTGVDIGGYTLTFHLTGYTDQTAMAMVSLAGPTTVTVKMTADPSQLTPPVLAVSDTLAAGFGKSVDLDVTPTGGKTPYTYAWKQTGGPTVSLTNPTAQKASFTTGDLKTMIGKRAVDNARFGAMGVNSDQAGHYTFEVTVTDAAGAVATADVNVNATRVSTGLRNVAVGLPVYLQGDGTWPTYAPATPTTAVSCTADTDCAAGLLCTGTTTKTCTAGCNTAHACPAGLACSAATAGSCSTQTAWNWTVTDSAGVAQTVSDANTQFPSFTPSKAGTYTATETNSGKTLKIYAGTWMGVMTDTTQDTCTGCHGPTDKSTLLNLDLGEFNTWKGTKHYSSLKNKLDGVDTSFFAEECLSCHALGYEKTAANNGFDDAETGSGWTFPTKMQANNYAALQAASTNKLNDRAGIQCENCHGPQAPIGTAGQAPHSQTKDAAKYTVTCTKNGDCDSGRCDLVTGSATNGKCIPDFTSRISQSADVCASCHQEEPYQYKPEQWAQGKHADLSLAIGEGSAERQAASYTAAGVLKSPGNLAHCGRCHSAQGFSRYAGELANGYYAHLTSDGAPLGTSNHRATAAELSNIGMNLGQVQSQTCSTCHDPHGGTNKYQLRAYDSIKALPNGMTNITGMGTGAICITCHNSRNAEHSDFATNTTDGNGNFVALPYLNSFSGPHSSAQGDMVYGFNTYFMPRYTPSAHLAVGDSCAGCHIKVATDGNVAAKQTSNHSFSIDNSVCKACHAAGVDGDALQAANSTQLDGLKALIAQKTLKSLQLAMGYVPATGTMSLKARAYDLGSDSYSTSSSTITPTTAGLVELAGNTLNSVDFSYAKNGTTMMLVLNLGTAVGFTTSTNVVVPASTKLYVAFTGLITNQKPTDGDQIYWPSASTYFSPFSIPAAKGTDLSATPPIPLIGSTYPTMPTPPPWFTGANNGANSVQVLYKAYWNLSVLMNDNTFGIHNPTFFNSTVAATTAQLRALP